MSSGVVAVVLAAGLVHAVWNAMAKSITDQATSFALMNVAIAILSWIVVPFVGVPRSHAWPYLLCSVACHVGYELFLMGSYRRADFSRAYPIARGVAPLLVSLAGLVVANEHVGFAGAAGIVAVVAGVTSLSYLRSPSRLDRIGIYWALATGVAIATYSVVDGLGVRASHDTLAYATSLFALQASIWVVAVLVRRGPRISADVKVVGVGLGAGALSLGAYTAVLWAQAHAPLGIVSALRETGVVWASLIGIFVFKEGRVRTILVPAVVVAGGIILLSVG